MKVYCFFCGERYFCNLSNSRLFGPVLETTCPHCKEKLIKNFSSFIGEQLDMTKFSGGKFDRITVMINIGLRLSKTLNDDDKKKRKKKRR